MPTLNWIGKDKVINHHLDLPFCVLEHQYGFNEQGKQDYPPFRFLINVIFIFTIS